jgi:hypothetical protein
MTRRVLTLKENLALVAYCEEHWPDSHETGRAFALKASTDLKIDGLNEYHVRRIVEEFNLVKSASTPATILARLAALESAVAALQAASRSE